MNGVRTVDDWLTDLQAHRDQLKSELVRIERLLRAAKQAESELTPTGVRRAPGDSMLGQISRVFEESPHDEFTAEQVWSLIRDRGVGGGANDPVNSVRGSLSRLKKRRIIEDVRRGVFRLRHEDPPASDPWVMSADASADPWAQGGDDPPF